MTYIAMNRFRVVPGKEAAFEAVWASREGRLQGNPGFVEFRMLRGAKTDEYTLYSSHTVWASEADFVAWTKSEAFRLAHKNAGAHRDLYAGPPQFEGFSSIMHES